jgi:hypothetical protein
MTGEGPAMVKRLGLALILMSAWMVVAAAPTSAATCVRFTSSQSWNPPGSDTGSNLRNEWVRIKNYCSTDKSISGWKIWDRGKIHKYTFPTGQMLKAGLTMTLHTGYGDNTGRHRYWDLGSAVWNNSCPEKAYLYSPVSQTVKDTWTSC